MAPKKLTEADKAAILGLYRQPEETTSTLAERYGVSNSTISRLLKASLPEAEYKTLIQQKRGTGDRDLAAGSAAGEARPEPSVEAAAIEAAVAEVSLKPDSTPEPETNPEIKPEGSKAPPILKKRGATADPAAAPEVAAEVIATAEPATSSSSSEDKVASRAGGGRRKRSRGASADPASAPTAPEDAAQLTLTNLAETEPTEPAPAAEPTLDAKPSRPAPVKKAAAKAASPQDDWAEDSPTLDDDYAEDEDDDDDEDDWDGDASEVAPRLDVVEISPLTPSDLPPQCYLVVERASSELVVLPLKTFASLGQIPDEEGDHRTLPVFDNQRVARRFSRRNQRVIKVPDGSLLETTRPYLQAKGITRLLIDGHVFALEDPREAMAEASP
ncbi:hypothetical protein GFS31_01990 [Leptolyngbya sp. BL0902]|uniref:helix-turn-helix domain-containing protein n=1 Tax=Leptolyngbya sp. BL0902 TaxID=1115757 RepID=UPI0018E78E79|nr:hypothetical protein [Leptolyngbya sp. BL0902]QQE63533.1 hypothetical protein GFS31_01990 [Leptolyngbya sp. BL0902]